MKIFIKNLGSIKEVEIELGRLTIFVGKNNSGKTYLNYILYAILNYRGSLPNATSFFKDSFDDSINKGLLKIDLEHLIKNFHEKYIRTFEKKFLETLDSFFSAEPGTFSKTEIRIISNIKQKLQKNYELKIESSLKIGKEKKVVCETIKDKNSYELNIIFKDSELPKEIYIDYINEVFFKIFLPEINEDSFILPSERTGINLFYQELNNRRNALINHLQKNKINPMDVIKDLIISKYPQPIADYIDFLNDLPTLKKKNKTDFSEITKYLQKNIVQGKYHVTKDGNISFNPYKTNFSGNNETYKKSLDLHLSSSTVKTFFSLDFYFTYMATKNSYLIIDEPELNLHPDNQRKIARLLALSLNIGQRIILSTHSDYIIREFNNLIMLSKDFPQKQELMNKYNYKKEMIISPDNVRVYLLDEGKASLLQIETEGIIAETFDTIINDLNNSGDEIYYSLIGFYEDSQ